MSTGQSKFTIKSQQRSATCDLNTRRLHPNTLLAATRYPIWICSLILPFHNLPESHRKLRLALYSFLFLALTQVSHLHGQSISLTVPVQHKNPIQTCVFSPNNELVATAASGNEQTVKIWSTETGKLIKEKSTGTWISSLEFSEDSQSLLIRSGHGVTNWDLIENSTAFTARDISAPTLNEEVVFGNRRWRINRNEILILADQDTLEILQPNTSSWHLGILKSPTGHHAISFTETTVTIWDESGTEVSTFGGFNQSGAGYQAKFHGFLQNGINVLISFTGFNQTTTLHKVHVETGVIHSTSTNFEPNLPITATISPNNNYLAAWQQLSNVVKILDTNSLRTRHHLKTNHTPETSTFINAKTLIAEHDDWRNDSVSRTLSDIKTGQILRNIKSHRNYDLFSASHDGKHIAYFDNGNVSVLDINYNSTHKIPVPTTTTCISFSGRNNFICIADSSGSISIHETESYTIQQTIPSSVRNPDILALNDRSNSLLIYSKATGDLELWDLNLKEVIPGSNVNWPGIVNAAAIIQNNGNSFLIESGGYASYLLFVYEEEDESDIRYSPLEHDYLVYSSEHSEGGEFVITAGGDDKLKLWSSTDGSFIASTNIKDLREARANPRGSVVMATSTGSVKFFDPKLGLIPLNTITLDNVDIVNSLWISDEKVLILDSQGIRHVYELRNHHPLFSAITFEDSGWLAWDSEYRYDGSPEAIEQMHFACGLEVIELSQAKGALYVPNLVSRIMSGEDLSGLPGLDDQDLCGRTPIVTPLPGDGRGYQFDIEPRKGGVSSCEVYIDGVRRFNIPASDLQPQDDGHLLLTVSAEQVAEYATAAEAEVTVIARTAGNLTSRGSKTWAAVADPRGNSHESQPAFHGLFVGINDYKGDGLKLNYAAADARELGQVVEAAAKRLFGEDEVHVTNLLSDAATGAVTNPPEKHRVLAELEAIAQRSNARDILFIHLAGHGNVNADGEFVFLTSEASSLQDGDYTGVTMREINDALMGVKASQRILILDACHSGEAVQDLLGDGSMDMAYTARNSVSVEEDVARGRQLDRLGDNANMTMLTASASDQAAFELPEIGHGLLTFALLDAIQGHTDILTEGRFLEVKPWVYQAEKTVNDRSTGPNRQQAQALTPANYPIGEITADVRELIQIQEKPVIKRIVFEDENEELAEVFEEALKLALSEESGARGSGSVLINEQHPKGITLKGTAVDQGNGTYSVSFTLKRKGEHIGQGEGNGLTIEDVIARIQALLSE